MLKTLTRQLNQLYSLTGPNATARRAQPTGGRSKA